MNVKKQPKGAYHLCSYLKITEDEQKEFFSVMSNEILMSLAQETCTKANFKCYPSHINELPTGEESGKFLALQVHSKNNMCFIGFIELVDKVENMLATKSYQISEELKIGSGGNFFAFLAECLADFLLLNELVDEELSLGLTWPFPLQQASISEGTLISWTMGYKCDRVVGKDVVQLLQQAIDHHRPQLKVKVVAVFRGTTGLLMSCALAHNACRIAVNTDAPSLVSYVEKTTNIEIFDTNKVCHKPHMIVICDWGKVGDNGVLKFIRNAIDVAVDKVSPNYKQQTFVKLISAEYAAELARQIVLLLIEREEMFINLPTGQFLEPFAFKQNYIWEILSDPPGEFQKCTAILEKFNIKEATDQDKSYLRHICESVSERSAKFFAFGLACLIKKINVPELSIAIGGTFYRENHSYRQVVVENVRSIVGNDYRIRLVLTNEAPNRGAAVVAACALNIHRKHDECRRGKMLCAKQCTCPD